MNKQQIQHDLQKLQAQSDEVTSRIKELKEALTEPTVKWHNCMGVPVKVTLGKSLPHPDYLDNRGLLFDTAEEAKKHDDYLLALAKVTKAIKVYNGDWKVDFSKDTLQSKFHIYLQDDEFNVAGIVQWKNNVTGLYIKDKKGGEYIRSKFAADLHTILSY